MSEASFTVREDNHMNLNSQIKGVDGLLPRAAESTQIVETPIVKATEVSAKRFAMQKQLTEAETILFAAHKWPRLVVRGLYRYEHAGFGGAFEPGNPVTLEREPNNTFDSNAVKVFLQDGKMLGYIAKEMSALISEELKRGVQFVVFIANSRFLESKWGQCELEIAFKISPDDFEKLEMLTRLDQNEVMNHYSGIDPYLESGVWVNCRKSRLAEAVEKNDVATAQQLVVEGNDVNEMTFLFAWSDGKHIYRFGFYTNPILMQVRSLAMYKLFVESGACLHPRSSIRHYGPTWNINGKEHNLLDTLWRGSTMNESLVELADYLVFTGYDMSLRERMGEIKKSCMTSDGSCPYENNKSYVLEWCDMEERAIFAANEVMKREYTGPYSLGHDLMHFISAWVSDGYDKAVEWYKGELWGDEIPPRYVYPERITRRWGSQR